jgi:transcriptional regulator with XRE-family HTH domain
MTYDTKKLERARMLRGWSMTTLARKALLSPCTVGRLERGEHIRPETVKKIADKLKISMEDLLVADPEFGATEESQGSVVPCIAGRGRI